MKKIISILFIAVIILSACSSGESSKELIFWSAPNVAQFDFWTKKAEEYNEQSSNGYTIVVQQMPETPSSEAGIQNAIATGEPPVASENVTRGFATELNDSGAIVNLDDYDDFNKTVTDRNMTETISTWNIDGNNYVLPIYSVPMLMAWNTDMLSENNVEIPTSYDEALDAAEEMSDGSVGLLNGQKYMVPEDWWEQWFYTLTYYESESKGDPFYENEELVADEDAMLSFLNFLYDLNKIDNGLYTSDSVDPFENKNVASTMIGGWQIPFWNESYPDLKYGENFELTAPLNSSGDGEYTFADSKGIVMYKGYEDEQYNEMMKFINYTFSGDGDMQWLEATGLTPARDDLVTNELFSEYFEKNPAIKPFAEYVPYAIPSMSSADMVDIQTAMGKEIQKMLNDDQSPEDTWKNIKDQIEELTNE